MGNSTDYHDYVFRGGKLVGEFEEMYQNSSTVPWHQDEQANWMDVRLTKEMICDMCTGIDQIHDLGCGVGHYLHLIATELVVPQSATYGYDISKTACEKASAQFPEATFSVLDLTEESASATRQALDGDPELARLFMIRGTLWYVFPHMATVVENIKSLMTPADRLLVVQNFPPLDTQFIGKDVIPDHHALVDHFSACFTLDRHLWYESRFGTANDNWFVGVFSPND